MGKGKACHHHVETVNKVDLFFDAVYWFMTHGFALVAAVAITVSIFGTPAAYAVAACSIVVGLGLVIKRAVEEYLAANPATA